MQKAKMQISEYVLIDNLSLNIEDNTLVYVFRQWSLRVWWDLHIPRYLIYVD
jgi:hypothetical protein